MFDVTNVSLQRKNKEDTEDIMRKQILFTEIGKAKLQETDLPAVKENDAAVKTEYTVISGGTERACLLGMNNTSQKFPMSLGYRGVGRIMLSTRRAKILRKMSKESQKAKR